MSDDLQTALTVLVWIIIAIVAIGPVVGTVVAFRLHRRLRASIDAMTDDHESAVAAQERRAPRRRFRL